MRRRRTPWTASMLEWLALNYATASHDELERVCGRPFRLIAERAHRLNPPAHRHREPKMSRAEYLRSKADCQARKRAKDPEAARQYGRSFYHANKAAICAKNREVAARRFFWTRAKHLRGPGRAGMRDLARLWKCQRGLCAVTGARLDRTAQLDHIIPKARGGGDEPSNLRWVTLRANLSKRDMTDVEFVALCESIVAVLGRVIRKDGAA